MRSFLSLVALSLVLDPRAVASDSPDAGAAITRLGGTFEVAPSGTGAILKIDLHESRVADADLALLSGCSDLRSLDLRLTQVSDAALAHVYGLHRLQFLNLFRTHVTDAGIASLARLEDLETLLLGGTRVTDRGLEALKPLSKLRKLSVFDTRVTDAGLVYLEGLPALEIVLVAKTHGVGGGKRNLRRRIRRSASRRPRRSKPSSSGSKAKRSSRLPEQGSPGAAFEETGSDLFRGLRSRRRRRGRAGSQEEPALATAWNDHGWTALHLAAFSGSPETARSSSTAVRIRTSARGRSSEHAAPGGPPPGSHETAKLLLERGSDPNVRQAKGFTPLQEAALLGRRDLVDLLLAHGAEPNSRADDGRTAVTEALRGKHAELADYLRSKGGKGAEITADLAKPPE